jgi:hypothetical protein
MSVYNLFVISFILIIGYFTSFHRKITLNDKQKAIMEAINDFSISKRLIKNDSVFQVTFQDTVYKMVLKKIDSRNSKWIHGKIYQGIKAVRIGANHIPYIIANETKTAISRQIPTRFIEIKGKLFYWWDEDYPITNEVLIVLNKYGLLKGEEAIGAVYDYPIDESKKATHYYFCSSDLTKFQRVITNEAIGYYEPPKLKCNSK